MICDSQKVVNDITNQSENKENEEETIWTVDEKDAIRRIFDVFIFHGLKVRIVCATLKEI